MLVSLCVPVAATSFAQRVYTLADAQPMSGIGLSDAPLSSGEREWLVSVLFVAPHSSDDTVGELAFVGSSGFASGLAFAGFAGEVGGGIGLAALLGDRHDVQHRVDAPIACEIEPVPAGIAAALA